MQNLDNPARHSSTSTFDDPQNHLFNAHHQYLYHPGQLKHSSPGLSGKIQMDPLLLQSPSSSSSTMNGSYPGSGVQLPPLFYPDLPPIPIPASSSKPGTIESAARFGSGPSSPCDGPPGSRSAGSGRTYPHPRPNPQHLQSTRPQPRTQPRGAAGPGPRTIENRSRNVAASKGYEERSREQNQDRQAENQVGAVSTRNNSGTVLADGLDVREILQTYRALRDRLPEVFPRSVSSPVNGVTKFKQQPRRPHTSPQPQSSASQDHDISNAPVGEKEELREILRLAMDGFKLVGSVFANQTAKHEREVKRPATEPSGRRHGSGMDSFSQKREQEVGYEVESDGRTYLWEGQTAASSPDLSSARETSSGSGLFPPPAPSMGIPSSSASSTPVAHVDLTPKLGLIDPPNRVPSGSSSIATRVDSDIPPSSPLPDGTGDRSNSVGNNNNGQAVANPVCLGCGATETPEWRRGPMGPRTLCNACGLVFAKLVRKRAREAAKAQAIAKGLLPPKKARSSKKAKTPIDVEKAKV